MLKTLRKIKDTASVSMFEKPETPNEGRVSLQLSCLRNLSYPSVTKGKPVFKSVLQNNRAADAKHSVYAVNLVTCGHSYSDDVF